MLFQSQKIQWPNNFKSNRQRFELNSSKQIDWSPCGLCCFHYWHHLRFKAAMAFNNTGNAIEMKRAQTKSSIQVQVTADVNKITARLGPKMARSWFYQARVFHDLNMKEVRFIPSSSGSHYWKWMNVSDVSLPHSSNLKYALHVIAGAQNDRFQHGEVRHYYHLIHEHWVDNEG